MIRTIRGADIGAQLFVGAYPTPSAFQAPTMDWESRTRTKPGGGLWTSTLREGPTSAWVEWCQDNNPGWVDESEWWSLTPEPSASLVLIDSTTDLDAVARRYRYVAPYLQGAFFDDDYFAEIDFVGIANDGYAGVHVTERGFLDNRWSLAFDLSRYDCESTIWLRWAFVGEPMLTKSAIVAVP